MTFQKIIIGCIFAAIVFCFWWLIHLSKTDLDRSVDSGDVSSQVRVSDNDGVLPENAAMDTPELTVENSAEQEFFCHTLDDFTATGDWFTVNDNVMGGRSLGGFRVENGILMHDGSINTNGGGFSSVRRTLQENALVGYSRAVIRIDTGGRQYAVGFEDNRYRNVSHQFIIEPSLGGGWQEVQFAFRDTVSVSFGEEVEALPFLSSAIESMRFSLNDGIDGPFAIAVDWIKICR